MKQEVVERSSRIIRKIATGLCIWNIVGIIFVILGMIFLIGLVSVLVQNAPSSNTTSTVTTDSFVFPGIMAVLSIILAVFECILYRRISKKSKAEELPQSSWINMIIGINVYNIIVMIVVNLVQNKSIFSYQEFIPIVIKIGLLAWMYVEYRKWQAVLEEK